MARPKAFDVFKRDTILLTFLKTRRGESSIVSSKEISEFLNKNGYPTNPNIVHSIVRRIMYERNAPICHFNARGYYWAESKAEIEKTILDLETRRNALQEHTDHLKNFIIE